MAKNKRQPYAVSEKAGEQTSAESWGTGTLFGTFFEIGRIGSEFAKEKKFAIIEFFSMENNN